jgi:hypothetical protein
LLLFNAHCDLDNTMNRTGFLKVYLYDCHYILYCKSPTVCQYVLYCKSPTVCQYVQYCESPTVCQYVQCCESPTLCQYVQYCESPTVCQYVQYCESPTVCQYVQCCESPTVCQYVPGEADTVKAALLSWWASAVVTHLLFRWGAYCVVRKYCVLCANNLGKAHSLFWSACCVGGAWIHFGSWMCFVYPHVRSILSLNLQARTFPKTSM